MLTTEIYVAAAGYNTRLREDIERWGFGNLPKHLLPTTRGGSETLLGRIVRQALSAPGGRKVTIVANDDNATAIMSHPDVPHAAKVKVGDHDNSLGPFTQPLIESGQRTLGCAGDFFADFTWAEFLENHEKQGYPVSFMVGQTVAVDGGAAFDVAKDGQITALRRADRTSASELINIGAYILDPDDMVLKILDEMNHIDTPSKEDVLVNRLILNGLTGAYQVNGNPFNINTAESYLALLNRSTITA